MCLGDFPAVFSFFKVFWDRKAVDRVQHAILESYFLLKSTASVVQSSEHQFRIGEIQVRIPSLPWEPVK